MSCAQVCAVIAPKLAKGTTIWQSAVGTGSAAGRVQAAGFHGTHEVQPARSLLDEPRFSGVSKPNWLLMGEFGALVGFCTQPSTIRGISTLAAKALGASDATGLAFA